MMELLLSDRDHRADEQKKGEEMLSIVVPTKNESASLEAVLSKLIELYGGDKNNEIFIVDGHSTDGTVDIARKLNVKVFYDSGKGKGDAVRAGIEHATNDTIVFIDADGSHDPQDIEKLVRPISDGRADLVLGSRMRGGSDELHGSLEEATRFIGSTIITQMINIRFKQSLTDYQNGFRAIRTSVAKQLDLKENISSIEQEMAMKALKKGFRVYEAPTHEYRRIGGTSKISLKRMALRYIWCVIKNIF